MTFVKRRFQQDDTAPADLQALGVEERRLPTGAWDWAVDEEREASFTQLLSATSEMREGDYWYALITVHSLAVIQINAWSSVQIGDRLHLKANFSQLPSNLSSSGEAQFRELAHEAMKILSVRSDGLLFVDTAHRS
ncbi:hypothetical protein [Variovorax boronicumulans]|uniref:hypothetical protein n=1 Tax=Variovorax boronicumulans TaxID=436515 RepID=UPI0012E6E088|nr:hypothetical protein [Variovorax boronicumulans]GER10342.1 hypothetical protein VHAB30_14980 [Variovorax boronicumulans]